MPSDDAEKTTWSAVSVRVAVRRRQLGLREADVYVVPATVAGIDLGDRREREDLRAVLLGEVQVVLDQGVLRVVATAGHAGAAADAGLAVGAGAAEVRVGDLVTLLLVGAAEEHPDRRRVERVGDAHVVGDLLHHVVGGRAERVLDDAEHALRLVVVRRELAAPVGDVTPLRVVVERPEGLVEGVRVDQRPAADARTGHDQAVLDRVDALDAVAADLGAEQELLDVERGLREVVVLETRTGLDDADAVALLGQP